jgi:hypothetical protein
MQQSRATLVTLALLVMFVAPLPPAPVLRAQEAPAIPDVQPTLAEPVFADPPFRLAKYPPRQSARPNRRLRSLFLSIPR